MDRTVVVFSVAIHSDWNISDAFRHLESTRAGVSLRFIQFEAFPTLSDIISGSNSDGFSLRLTEVEAF